MRLFLGFELAMHELSRQLSRPSKLAALICAVQEMCKEIYKNLSADSDFLLQLFQRFGVQFTAELFLMLQAHFCPSLRHSHQLVRLSRSIFKETHSWKSTMSQTIQCQWPESYHVCNVLCYTMRKLPGLKSNKYIGIAQKDCAQVLKSVHLSARRLDEKELLPCCWPSSSWLNDSAFRFQPVCKATSLCPSFCFQSVSKCFQALQTCWGVTIFSALGADVVSQLFGFSVLSEQVYSFGMHGLSSPKEKRC